MTEDKRDDGYLKRLIKSCADRIIYHPPPYDTEPDEYISFVNAHIDLTVKAAHNAGKEESQLAARQQAFKDAAEMVREVRDKYEMESVPWVELDLLAFSVEVSR